MSNSCGGRAHGKVAGREERNSVDYAGISEIYVDTTLQLGSVVSST